MATRPGKEEEPDGLECLDGLECAPARRKVVRKILRHFLAEDSSIQSVMISARDLMRFPIMPTESGRILNLMGNEIRALPPGLFKNPRVSERLACFSCLLNDLTTVPAGISACAELVSFNCGMNRLVSLPADLSECAVLRELDCASNRLATLPDFSEAKYCAALQRLYCGANLLASVPGISACTALTVFVCGKNRLKELPDLRACTLLVHLDCRLNQLEALPDWLGELPKLRHINFGNNRFETLPEVLGACKALDHTSMDDDMLSIAKFPCWKGNPFRELPAEFAGLNARAALALLCARWDEMAARRTKAAREGPGVTADVPRATP